MSHITLYFVGFFGSSVVLQRLVYGPFLNHEDAIEQKQKHRFSMDKYKVVKLKIPVEQFDIMG